MFRILYSDFHNITFPEANVDKLDVIDWLMAGDPVIRWQVMRDLLNCNEDEWHAERSKTVETGWGRKFLDCRSAESDWPEGRWTGTLWTLLQLIDCGLPADTPELLKAARKLIDKLLTAERAADPRLANPIGMLLDRAQHDGKWIVEKRISGVTLFDMKKMGEPSRWNTLRMLRVQKQRASSQQVNS